MIGKWFSKSKDNIHKGVLGTASGKVYDITEAHKISGKNFPQTPGNPYRKKNVKLVYKKSDFHYFRLPSEQAFLLSPFDTQDLFG
jgi:hypothetical protein